MSNDVRLEKLTRNGIALMQEERKLAMRGDLEALEELNARKEAFLAEIEEIAQRAEQGGPAQMRETRKKELAALFDILRRRAEENQYLLRAAQAGVKSAARTLDAVKSGPQGFYAADGGKLKSENNFSKSNGVF